MGQFERYEYKYLTTRALAQDFKEAVLPRMCGDLHNGTDGSYDISSLYFDNERFELYYQTKDRIPFRQKLRLRVYGEARADSQSFFEVKNKLNGRTFKNRLQLPLSEGMRLYALAASGKECGEFREYALSSSDEIALCEVVKVIRRYALKPSAVVSYNREAYFCPDLPSLRITFDSALRVRDTELGLPDGAWGVPTMEQDEVVVEVKCNHNIPAWLSRCLGERRMINRGFSKYCSLGGINKEAEETGVPLRISYSR